ncbi:MAG: hypothetical protein CL869_00650 [Cytophagia bacterium]|nr:hypothetical protein [Cytophagia bacterium]|tara:strand:+ start:731 stop:1225 length:495 start_codon:yes stop_codon:yes gene_type:complete
MKNLVTILCLCSFLFSSNETFSKNLDLGINLVGKRNDNWFEMIRLNFQVSQFRLNNFYQSVRLDYLQKTDLCYLGGCPEPDKGLGINIFYGKYYKSNYFLTSGSIGLGLDFIENKAVFTLPFKTEISALIRDKYAITVVNMIYLLPENYTFSLGMSLKKLNKFY